MGRVKLSVASRKSRGPVVLHLDPAVAHDLLQALTQALEPHPSTGKLAKNRLKGGLVKRAGLKAKTVVKGQSAKRKSPKGSGAKKSR